MADKTPDALRVGRSAWLAAVVQKHYQPITGSEAIKCDGAQQMNGQWWMPLWGCDTLDHLLEDVDYAAAKAANDPAHRPGKEPQT